MTSWRLRHHQPLTICVRVEIPEKCIPAPVFSCLLLWQHKPSANEHSPLAPRGLPPEMDSIRAKNMISYNESKRGFKCVWITITVTWSFKVKKVPLFSTIWFQVNKKKWPTLTTSWTRSSLKFWGLWEREPLERWGNVWKKTPKKLWRQRSPKT